jgi:hypothetical protein
MTEHRVEKLEKLLPSESVTSINKITGNGTESNKDLKGSLPTIKCECGAEILVLPDLQAMNRAIKAHVAEHKKKIENAQNNTIHSQSNISKLLSQLTLIKISAQNDAVFSPK